MPDLLHPSLLSWLRQLDSTQVNVVVGALFVPMLLQLFKREHWSARVCRLIAFGFAVIVAALQALLVGQSPTHLAESAVAIFAGATGVYHLFFVGALGDATQIDLLGKLLGKTIGDVAAKNETAIIQDISEIVAGIEQAK